jgi:hypothetical protein
VSGTLAVVTVWRGREGLSGGFDQAEAASMLTAIAELGGWDKPPEIRDLLPDLQQRFPLGRRVMLGPRAHWRPGQGGVVTAGEPESYACWPERGLSPWFICTDAAEVHVRLDDGYESWWRSTWLVPL